MDGCEVLHVQNVKDLLQRGDGLFPMPINMFLKSEGLCNVFLRGRFKTEMGALVLTQIKDIRLEKTFVSSHIVFSYFSPYSLILSILTHTPNMTWLISTDKYL